jgi:PAS domain S-box-containing protein
VYIGLSIDPIQQDKKEMYVIMLLITTVCMFMGAVLAFLFSRRLTKPILILEEVTRQIARGDLTTRANIITNNEIKSLANSFNTMTERLKNITVSKAYVDNIIQNMNDSLIVVNRNYLIETINKATEKLLGYSSEELLNQSIHMIIPDKKNDSFFYDLKNMSTRQVIFPKESYYINKKGQMIPVLLSVAEMRETPEDNYHAYLILALNLSEKKETELALKTAYLKLQKTQSQLVQSGKLASIGELAAGVAHELNQPLMVIRSTAQYIQLARKKNKFTMDEMDELIDTLEKNTSRMMKIINHLRMFSRQSEKEFTQVNVNKVIEDAFLLLSEQLRLRNISVNQELANHLPEIFGDPNQLEQVILNLLSNARDAITTKMESCKKTYAGIITISTQYDRSDTGYITISVKDNGSGIDESIVEKIFDPFYTTKDVGKGTGLGLSISYGIIEAHKGKIRVSFSDKKETIFTIKLPVERNNNE